MIGILDLGRLRRIAIGIGQEQAGHAQPARGVHEVLAAGHDRAEAGVHQEIEYVVAPGLPGDAIVVLVETFRPGFAVVGFVLGQKTAVGMSLAGVVLELQRGAELGAEVVAHAQKQAARILLAEVEKSLYGREVLAVRLAELHPVIAQQAAGVVDLGPGGLSAGGAGKQQRQEQREAERREAPDERAGLLHRILQIGRGKEPSLCASIIQKRTWNVN